MSLKSLFLKEDKTEPTVEKISQSTKKTTSTIATSVLSVNSLPSTSLGVSQKDVDDSMELLMNVYKSGNFPGPDYQEFMDALQQVDGHMDEATKFKTIFVAFKIQGLKKERILETANRYIDMIKNESLSFGQMVDNKLVTEIGDKKNKAESLNKENDEIEKQIARLNEKKAKNIETSNALIAEVTEQETTFKNKKAGFEIAANKFIAEVQSNIQKITSYL